MNRELEDVLAKEREMIATKLNPHATFIRGIQVGALVIGGINTMIPGQFGVADWPLWIRLLAGVALIVLAIHFLLEQRGYMIIKRISKV
jgi:cytochrome c biogenesis protein CcdA